MGKYLAEFSRPEKIFLPALVKAREVADFAVPDLERALLNVSKVYFFFIFIFFIFIFIFFFFFIISP